MLFLEFTTINGQDGQIRADQYRGCIADGETTTRIYFVSGGAERSFILNRSCAEVKKAVRDAFEDAQFASIS